LQGSRFGIRLKLSMFVSSGCRELCRKQPLRRAAQSLIGVLLAVCVCVCV
jgi:hypothetical protein